MPPQMPSHKKADTISTTALDHAALAFAFAKDDFHAALEEYQKALLLFRQAYLQGILISKGDAAVTLYNMGLLYRKTNQPHQSMACFIEAEELLLQLPSTDASDQLLAETMQQRACLHAKGEEHEALLCHEQVVSLLLSMGEEEVRDDYEQQQGGARISEDKRAELLTISLKALGLLYLALNNFDEGLGALEECLTMARVRYQRRPESEEISSLVLTLLLQLSSIYFQREDFDGVIALLGEALPLQQARGMELDILLNNLGLANERKGDLNTALHYYQDLLQIRRQRNDPIPCAESMVTCAKILERCRRSHDAMALYHDALAIYQQSPNLYTALIAEIMVRISGTVSVLDNMDSLMIAGSDSGCDHKTMDKAKVFYDLARQYLKQQAHQAALDCLLECRQLLGTLPRHQVDDFGIRVDALEQMIQNDQVIVAADDDDQNQSYESFHFGPSHDDLHQCLSSESATQFVEAPVVEGDDWTLPQLQTRLLVIEEDGVEMEHVERAMPSPIRACPSVCLFDDESITSEISMLSSVFDGRLGISRRPTNEELLVSLEVQSRTLQPSRAETYNIDEVQGTKLAKAIPREGDAPVSTSASFDIIDEKGDPELTLDMLELLEEESEDEDADLHSGGIESNESITHSRDTLDDHASLVATESYPGNSCAAVFENKSGNVLVNDSVDEFLDEDYMGIRNSMTAAKNGVSQIFGETICRSMMGQLVHTRPGDAEGAERTKSSDDHVLELSRMPPLNTSEDTGENPRSTFQQSVDDAEEGKSFETSDGEQESLYSDGNSQFHSDEDINSSECESDDEYDEHDEPVEEFLGSSGVPEGGYYWKDGKNFDFDGSCLNAEFKVNEERDDSFGRMRVVTVEMDNQAPTKTFSAMVAEEQARGSISPSYSPTDVRGLKPVMSQTQAKSQSAEKNHSRNRVANAISNTFRRVRKRNKASTMPEDATQDNLTGSKATVDSSCSPAGPVEVIKVRNRSRSYDTVSQITSPREDLNRRSHQKEEYDDDDDSQWWWGATVNRLEDTLYIAHVVADAADDFFSARSIHDKIQENCLDDDDKSGIFASLDDLQSDIEEVSRSDLELAEQHETKTSQPSRGPNLELIALEVDDAKWVPPKSNSSVRGTRGRRVPSKTQNLILTKLNTLQDVKLKHGPCSIEVSLSLVALAKLQLEVGEPEQATERILEALKIQKAVSNPLEMTRSLHVLAETYSMQQEFDQALACYKDAQRLERRIYGPDRPENASTLNRMGRVYSNLEEFSLAMEKHQQALKVLKGCYGENLRHPSVAQTLILIGEVYYRERNSFDTNRSNSDDYGTFIEAGMLDIIALAHEDRGSVKMALCFLEEKLQVLREKISPTTNEDLVETLYGLGNLSVKAGLFFEAMDYYEQALALQQKKGSTDMQIASANVLIGTVEFHFGHYKKSLQLLNDSLAILKLSLGDYNEVVADALQRIGSVEARLHNFDSSLSHLDQAFNIQKEILGLLDSSTMRTKMEIGIILLGEYKIDEAIVIFEVLKTDQENLFGAMHPDVADVLHQLGVACSLKCDFDKAMKLFEEAYQMRERFFGREHPSQASTLHEIVLLTLKKDQVRKAVSMCCAVLEVRKDMLGEHHIDVAVTISTLGRCQTVLGNFGASSKAFSEALPMAEAAVGGNHPFVGDIYIDMASLHLKKCEFDDAKRTVEAGLAIFKCANVPVKHPRQVQASQLLEKINRDEMLCV